MLKESKICILKYGLPMADVALFAFDVPSLIVFRLLLLHLLLLFAKELLLSMMFWLERPLLESGLS